MKKFIRNLQTFFPGLQDFRFATQKKLRTTFNTYYESDFAQFNNFKNIHTYVDVGANRGDTIHDVLRLLPDVQIVAFEPNVSLYKKLLKQTASNTNVKIHNTGIGNSKEVKDFFLPRYRNYIFDGLASFSYEAVIDMAKHELPNFKEELLTVEKHQFQISRLDDFNLKPDFIKMDVQGYEYLALCGAEKTLREFKPLLLIEAPDKECFDLLEKLDYIGAYIENGQFVLGKGTLNTFFINRANASHYFVSERKLQELMSKENSSAV